MTELEDKVRVEVGKVQDPETGQSFEEMQTAIFRWALRRSRGSRRRAAQALGISRSTFCDRVRKFGLADGTAYAG